MGKEIERKFLVASDAYKAEAASSTRIRQGYVCRKVGKSVRVRFRDDKAFLTIKAPLEGFTKFEWEIEITPAKAEELWAIVEPGTIEKTRYLVPDADGKHIWEVDEFFGDNIGLVVAEVELDAESEDFGHPSWLGEEVTGDDRYYNSTLTIRPFNTWNNR